MNLFDRTMLLLSRTLDFRSARHEVLASNIANADTPGYVGVDLVFEEALKKASLEGRGGRFARTHPKHLPEGFSPSSVVGRIEPTGNPFIGMDRNSVNVEQEMVRLAENTLLYEAAIQMLTQKLRGLKEAIREGR